VKKWALAAEDLYVIHVIREMLKHMAGAEKAVFG
jgi:hypothetical protein